MERKRRRWWTWGLSTVAALVVLAATLSLVFRLVVDAVPDYRNKLQGLVTQAAGHPTRIGSMALTWQRLQPSLDLRDVALLDEQGKPLLQLSRLRLGFSLGRLLTADWMPGTVEVYGLQLEADVDDLGRWSLRGFNGGGGGKIGDAELQRLDRLDRVRLRDSLLLVHDPQFSRQALSVGVTDAEVHHEGSRYTLTARLRPPPELAATASASATLQGDLSQPQSWQGSAALQLDDIQGWPWLAGTLGPGVRLTLQQAQLRLSGRVEAGHIAEIDAQAGAAAIAAVRGNDTLARVTQLQLDVAAWPEPRAWRTEVRKLALNGARGTTTAQGHFRYAVTDDGSSLDGGADGLRLDDLAPWLVLWKDLPASAARLRDVRGDVHELAVHYEQANADNPTAARYKVHARLAGAGLAADATQDGFSGLDAVVEADQDGGHLQLQKAALTVQLPGAFEQALPVTSLSGDFGWKRGDAAAPGWRIGAPQFDWKLLGTSGHGQFSLLLPEQADASPDLQLTADFAAEDVIGLKPWIPKDWGAGTRDWLTRALQRGHVSQGHLQLDGPLADYPYVEKTTGHWLLDLMVADGTLAYAPGWPQAEKLQAQLRFRGHGLQISSSGAQIAGNAVDHIEAQIPDFRQARLTVDGSTHGDAARYYGLLRNSPLNKKLSSLLTQTDASGPAAVDVHLDIPLNVEDPPVHVAGTARFDGGTVKVRAIDPPVTGLRGSLAFDDNGVTSNGLSGQLYGSTLNATIRAEPESPDGVLLVQTDAPAQQADGLLAAYTPEWLRQRLDGTVHVTARLPFAGPHSGQLSLGTDLRGVAVNLPQPVAKSAEDSLPLTITVGEGGSAKTNDADALRVRIDGGDRFAVALRFGKAKPSADALLTRSVEVRLGPGEMPRADAGGVFISGAPAVLDAIAWTDLFDAIDAAGEQKPAKPSPPVAGAAAGSESLPFRGFDLTPQQLVYRGATLQQAHLLGKPEADGWSVQVDGANAQGHITFSRANGGHLQARLQRLQLQPLAEMSQPGKGGDAAAPSPPFDPNQAPLLDLACDSLKLGDADLGHFSLLTSRTAGGQALDLLKFEGGQLQTNTRGTWLRRNGSSYADLSFEFDARDLGKVLQAFGYAETMDGKKAKFSGTLTWPQSPNGLELTQARGKVTLAVEKGALKAVKPGAGRVLGILNLYALPRRLLTLDFHDVVSTGLGFDTLGGNFNLADGQAQTTDLQVDAPSMKLQMSGRIGLATRDYDQKITVYPNVTTGVTVGATLIGGPIAGGIALLAQEVFNKPFNALSQFSYRVTGSWDNPQVKVGTVKPATDKDAPNPPPPPAPAPPPVTPPAPQQAPSQNAG